MNGGRLLTAAALAVAVGSVWWSADRVAQGERRLAAQLSRLEERLDEVATAQAGPAAPQVQLQVLSLQAALAGIDERLARLDKARPVAAPPPPAPPTAEQLTAADRGRALVARGIGTSRWTEDDRQELLALSAATTPELRNELARALIRAVNAGQIAVDGTVL